MAFVIPTFNLVIDVYTGPVTSPVFRFTTNANLQFGRRRDVWGSWPGGGVGIGDNVRSMWLLLPRLTDIRDYSCAGGYDLVEVPAASGRLYIVDWVDDVAKGFANEFRCALITKYTIPWPTPIP